MPNFLVRYIPSNTAIPALQSRPGVRLKRLREGCYEVNRLMTAKDATFIVREITRDGGTPLEIRQHYKTFLNTEVVTKGYKKRFLQALAFNIEAGMSAGKALETVIRSEPNVNLQLELTAASDILAKGGLFSEALDAISFFDQVTISILVAGERTGSLRQAMQSALAHYEQKNNTKKAIFGMFSFVLFDLVTVFSAAWGVQTQFIPMMEKQGITSTDPAVVAEFHRKIELGYLMNGTLIWLAVVIAVVASVFTYFAFSRKPSPAKAMVEGLIRKTPILSQFFTNTAVAESFAVAAAMLSGKVQFSETIIVASESTTYPVLKRYWEHVKSRLMLGDTVARAMKFDPISEVEYLLLTSTRSSEQLTKVVRDIANERAARAESNAILLNRLLLVGAMSYAGASVLIYLWLLFVQNEQVMSGLGA